MGELGSKLNQLGMQKPTEWQTWPLLTGSPEALPGVLVHVRSVRGLLIQASVVLCGSVLGAGFPIKVGASCRVLCGVVCLWRSEADVSSDVPSAVSCRAWQGVV